MRHAVGIAGVGLIPAEVEVGFAGMAHRPAADAVIEVEQRGLVGDIGRRLGRDQRRGGAGGIGAWASPGPRRMKSPGPTERYCISFGSS